MAHQCWNDGTDRSTLPIHGMSLIGTWASPTETEPAQGGTFFVTGTSCRFPLGDRVPSSVTAAVTLSVSTAGSTTRMLEAIALTVQVLMMRPTVDPVTVPNVGIAGMAAEILVKGRRGKIHDSTRSAVCFGFITATPAAFALASVHQVTDRLGR